MRDDELRSTKDRPGWLLPYLFALDEMFYGRWEYWLQAVMTDQIPKEPIPLIHFEPSMNYSQKQVRNNIDACLSYAEHSHSNVLEKFIDWILWGLNYRHNVDVTNIDAKTDDYWYRTFNLGLFYTEPADHFADVAADKRVGIGTGFFPTPSSVTEMMVRMNFGDKPSHQHKRLSVCDPCCGTGIMLLHASNYSLNMYGIDIHPLIYKIALVNSYIYVPWLAYRPKGIGMFDKQDAIRKLELPTGIVVLECKRCGNHQDFIMELETACELIGDSGLWQINQSSISQDIVNRKLVPENISCAMCGKEEN